METERLCSSTAKSDQVAFWPETGTRTHTDGGDCGDDFPQLEFVQDGGFSGSIQTDHQDSHLFLPEEIFKEACKHVPHDGRSAKDKNKTISEYHTSF